MVNLEVDRRKEVRRIIKGHGVVVRGRRSKVRLVILGGVGRRGL